MQKKKKKKKHLKIKILRLLLKSPKLTIQINLTPQIQFKILTRFKEHYRKKHYKHRIVHRIHSTGCSLDNLYTPTKTEDIVLLMVIRV